MAYYSGTLDEIKLVLRSLGIGEGTLDSLSPDQVYESQAYIDGQIDSILSEVYYVPLREITRSGVTKYPDPIPHIARRMVAADLIINTMTDVDQNVVQTAQNVDTDERNTMYEFASQTIGSRKLAGQLEKTRNHFAPPGIFPGPNPVQR